MEYKYEPNYKAYALRGCYFASGVLFTFAIVHASFLLTVIGLGVLGCTIWIDQDLEKEVR